MEVAINEIHIHTDAGRCARPVYIVKDNQLTITDKHLERLRGEDGQYSWLNLIGGDRNKEIMEYDCNTTIEDFDKLKKHLALLNILM